MPDEARQPSMLIEMVPIHTKRMLWKMGERIILMMPFCLCREAFYFPEIGINSLTQSNPICKF